MDNAASVLLAHLLAFQIRSLIIQNCLCLWLCFFYYVTISLPFSTLPYNFPLFTPLMLTCLWAAVGGGSGDAGPGHVHHSVRLHVGSPPHRPRAVLPPRPQVQHQEHPLKHSRGHVFVGAGVSARGQSNWTTGRQLVLCVLSVVAFVCFLPLSF